MKELIDKGFRNAFHIWKEELKQVFRDPGVIIFFLVVPFAYPVLYALIYNQETAREVPMVVVDLSATPASREFVRKIDGMPDVKVVARCASLEEAKAAVDAKHAYGTLFIPASFSEDIHTGKQTCVSLFCDMGALLYYKALLLAATEVSLEMGKEIRLSHGNIITSKQEKIAAQPVLYEPVALYNTQNGFSSFLVPAILILVIQQTLLLGVGMLAGTARERNRFRSMIPQNNRYDGALRIVLGKSSAYLVIYILVCFWALMVVPFLFNLPRIGDYSTLLLFTLPYLLACIFFSMSVSCIISGRETPMLIFVFSSVPLLFISGISWPLSAIPEAWKWVSYLFPSTFGIQGFVKVNSMGASLHTVAFEYRAMWLQTGGYFILSGLLYRYQINRSISRSQIKSL
jgi:ABC-2 type transport system permease protein